MGKHLRAIRKAVMTQEHPACLPALEAGRGSEGGSNFFRLEMNSAVCFQ